MKVTRETLTLAASWLGIAAFFGLVGTATALYPGGHRFDELYPSFSLLYSFLCDLFSSVAYNGQPNPGRPFAIAGTYALALALLFFWNLVPSLFATRTRVSTSVRVIGSLAMFLSLLIPSPLHDWCILIAVPLGLIALGIAIFALVKAGERTLARLGVISVLICVLNYVNFVTRTYPKTLASLQKLALLSFLVWVLATLTRVSQVLIRGQREN